MEQFIMGLFVFGIVVFVRRREAFRFRWQPTRHVWIAVGTGVLAAIFSASMLLVGPNSLAAKLIHRLLIYAVCGVAIPWGYTLLVERNTPAAMGLTRERWRLSLLLSVIIAFLLSLVIIFEADLAAIDWRQFARAAVALVGAGGLFELFLYYGFIHLRLEKAFGMIPAILLTALIYVPWHTGTQLPLEPDPLAAVWKLFWVGVMAQAIFGLTRNLLIIWPFFHAVGVMIDFTVNLGELKRTAANFPWAVGMLALMAITGTILASATKGHRRSTR